MGMVREKWSVNGLSNELGVDRRTIARRLHDVKPVGAGPRGSLYLMADVYRALTGYCWDCGEAERKDRFARAFIEHVGKRSDLEELAARLCAAPSPEARGRVLREFFASQLWSFVRDRKDPACPAWAPLSERGFDRAWRALSRDGETLGEVAARTEGAKGPRITTDR